MQLRNYWPSILLCFTIVILLLVGLVAEDPGALCEESSKGACLITVSSLIGTAIVAVLTIAITFGQYYAGQSQARSAERQAQLAAIPLLDSEILALQGIIAFATAFDWHCSRIHDTLKVIEEENDDPSDEHTIRILSNNALRSFENITINAQEYFKKVQTHIIPAQAEQAYRSIIAVGQSFTKEAGDCSYFMEVLVGDDEHNESDHKQYALQKLINLEVGRAKRACTLARNDMQKALGEIRQIAVATRALRTSYLGPLAAPATPPSQ
jgi:hypothetical protein